MHLISNGSSSLQQTRGRRRAGPPDHRRRARPPAGAGGGPRRRPTRPSKSERERLTANQVARREIEKELPCSRPGSRSSGTSSWRSRRTANTRRCRRRSKSPSRRSGGTRIACSSGCWSRTRSRLHVKQADLEFAKAKADIEAERAALARDVQQSHVQLREVAIEREALVPQIPQNLVAIFDRVMRHHKLAAVAEARDGRCSICNVRLRPQVYNDLHRNDSIIQCDSCHRILYYTARPAPPQA